MVAFQWSKYATLYSHNAGSSPLGRHHFLDRHSLAGSRRSVWFAEHSQLVDLRDPIFLASVVYRAARLGCLLHLGQPEHSAVKQRSVLASKSLPHLHGPDAEYLEVKLAHMGDADFPGFGVPLDVLDLVRRNDPLWSVYRVLQEVLCLQIGHEVGREQEHARGSNVHNLLDLLANHLREKFQQHTLPCIHQSLEWRFIHAVGVQRKDGLLEECTRSFDPSKGPSDNAFPA
mmetsp:Transcript_15661/g.44672  ORF Transcript_15661/g.44672 Transcript_15661/m.44672 type:complete len:230 (-) Transcript_15661:15809-16498(-)